jgi:hypothetical protein
MQAYGYDHRTNSDHFHFTCVACGRPTRDILDRKAVYGHVGPGCGVVPPRDHQRPPGGHYPGQFTAEVGVESALLTVTAVAVAYGVASSCASYTAHCYCCRNTPSWGTDHSSLLVFDVFNTAVITLHINFAGLLYSTAYSTSTAAWVTAFQMACNVVASVGVMLLEGRCWWRIPAAASYARMRPSYFMGYSSRGRGRESRNRCKNVCLSYHPLYCSRRGVWAEVFITV